MSSAYETDWAAIGLLPDHGMNAFNQVPPKWVPPPPKEKIKAELAAQRNRESAKRRYHRLKALQNNMANPFCPSITTPEQSLRTQAIAGRGLK